MTCQFCIKKASIYNFNCLECCARLVTDSRPNRKKQETMLEVIGRFPNSPEREAILEKLKSHEFK